MLKMAVAVCVEPMAMQLRAILKATTNQTALTGVWVCWFTFARVLFYCMVNISILLLV